MIFWFSGTGNSRYIAEKLSAALNEPLYSITDAIRQGHTEPVACGSKAIFVTPTYCWRIPRLVRDWLLQTELPGAEKIWFVMDCGTEIGNAAKYNRMLAAQKNLCYMGTAQVVMPENYIAMFATPGEAEARTIIENARPVIESVISTIRDGKELPAPRNNLYDRIMSGPVNPVFYRFFVKANGFRVGDACIGCGKCERICPLNNIRLINGKPAWGSNCTHCMACISYCPEEAIEYGRHSVGLRRYHYER